MAEMCKKFLTSVNSNTAKYLEFVNCYYTLFQLQKGNMVWYTLSGFYIPRAGGEGNIQSRQRKSGHITFLELK